MSRRPSTFALAALVPAVLMAACNDPTGPCARPNACEVAGADLAVVDVRLANPAATDPVTNAPVAPSGDVDIDVVVRNRGSERAPAAEVQVAWIYPLGGMLTDSVPALAPGDSAVLRFALPVTEPFMIALTTDPARADLRGVRVGIYGAAADVEPTNNESALDVHVPIAVVAPSIEPVSAAKVRVGESMQVTYRLRNVSTRAAAEGVTLRLCLWDFDVGCFPGNWSTFGHVDVPVLAPGGEFTVTRNVTLVPGATWHDEDYQRALVVCVEPTTHTDPYLLNPKCDYRGSYIRVLPDYENVCNAPVLAAGVAHDFADHNCGFMSPTSLPELGGLTWDQRIRNLRFHVVAIDAEAGRPYRLVRSPASGWIQLFDADGANALQAAAPSGWFAFQNAGRYYAVMHATSSALSIVLE